MSTYFTDMCLVYLFHSIQFYLLVHYMYEHEIAYVFLFYGHVPCLTVSRCDFLLSGTLYVGTSNCFMSTYFMITYFCLVHIT